ncbi:dephospho-CoA kinase [Pseudomonadales bacterium]|jgi:dephospho-CoA kinase|nr:dephospho-CoA kinase [Pseudomonadales bacterium]MDG1703548.1 dephospho-CoA kinase [Pseudomonadales bacterium]
MLVGLTGGIGSGKSAAADRFAELGIEVVDADIASRTVVEPGQPALTQIASHFGPDLLNKDGTLNRPKLRAVVFADVTERKWLQKLLHPLISQCLKEQIEASTSAYCLLVNPLLLESGQSQWCDEIVVVDVPEELQISRTMERDNNSREQVEAILAAQLKREDRLAQASHVILNNDDLPHLYRQVDSLHEVLVKQ